MDPVEKLLGPSISNLLKNKYYFDELYQFLFVRPANWMAVTFTSLWMDRIVIDGILHAVASLTSPLGHFFRNYIDKAIVNWSGDKAADITQGMGGEFRTIQTGRIQQYMVLALVSIGIFGGFYYYVLPHLQSFLISLVR
jgi:NADH:ubiquinone oxidoreductase subunit 5 (subunit L)/multisubunit Na+/H+ antiporter MnhA subunit